MHRPQVNRARELTRQRRYPIELASRHDVEDRSEGTFPRAAREDSQLNQVYHISASGSLVQLRGDVVGKVNFVFHA